MTQAANLGALGTNVNSSGITQIAGGGTAGTGGVTGFKNRLINGNMAISQRGAVNVTASGGSTYIAADRFSVFNYFGSGQINTAISTSIVPAGYSYSLGLTVGTAVPLNGSTGYLVNVAQTIEGFNIADAYNQTVTVSFWVRSSITGTYSVSFYNASNAGAVIGTRLYATSYTINSANTWEQKTVTVDLSAGTASGTWDRGNGAGLTVAFGLGAESNRKGNTFLNTWGTFTSVYEYQVASQVNWASTLGATFYITGVQLEVGTAATNFDVRSYGTELQLCQRYYYQYAGTAGEGGDASQEWMYPLNRDNTYRRTTIRHPVRMRASPSVSSVGIRINDATNTSGSTQYLSPASWSAVISVSGVNDYCYLNDYKVSAEL